jgi:hypothetical protein
MKDVIECSEFYHDFYESKQSEFSVLQMSIFQSSVSLPVIGKIIDSKVGTCDATFLLNENQIEEPQFSWKCPASKIENEFYALREVLKLGGGSGWRSFSVFYRKKSKHCIEIQDFVQTVNPHTFCDSNSLTKIIFSSKDNLREINGFQRCTSLRQIKIPSSVRVIGWYGFCQCLSLNKVIFSSGSHLREIHGFSYCVSVCRIEIPSSVEIIGSGAFCECTSLQEIVFSSQSHLREIYGFANCVSVCRIEIPSSVEVVARHGFLSCRSLRIVIIDAGCRMKENEAVQNLHPFLIYDGDHAKKCRRQVHLGIPGKRVVHYHSPHFV